VFSGAAGLRHSVGRIAAIFPAHGGARKRLYNPRDFRAQTLWRISSG